MYYKSCWTTRSCGLRPYYQAQRVGFNQKRLSIGPQGRLQPPVAKVTNRAYPVQLLNQHCRTTRICRHKALLSSSGPPSIKKKLSIGCRDDCSRQGQARLHTVGFGLAQGQRPDGQPTWGVWQKINLPCGTQVKRGRIDGGEGYMVK